MTFAISETFTATIVSFAYFFAVELLYLGHMINSALSDDQDIMKQTRSFYARANFHMPR